ncbi:MULTISPECIES: hypothetical protein [Serratia]|uniref:hypothetical protein n=1 Tax=Serratia TaxID=613 RepID=UPI001EE5658E|nr:hypothetical protein [Serratia bockelmannii]
MLKNNPHYFGYFWDLMIENREIFSLKNLENAIRKNTSPTYDEEELFEAHTLDADRMRRFTHAIPSLSVGSASVWPRCPPLARRWISPTNCSTSASGLLNYCRRSATTAS